MKFHAIDNYAPSLIKILLGCIIILIVQLISFSYGLKPFYSEKMSFWKCDFFITGAIILIGLALLFKTRLRMERDGLYVELLIFGIKISSRKFISFENTHVVVQDNMIGFSKSPFTSWTKTDFVVAPLMLRTSFLTTLRIDIKNIPFFHVINFKKFVREIIKKSDLLHIDQNSLETARKMSISN